MRHPINKKLPCFYFFGQTIHPITLETLGAYELYGLTLYPFAVRTLIDVNTKKLNDDCYDLRNSKHMDTSQASFRLQQATCHSEVVSILTG